MRSRDRIRAVLALGLLLAALEVGAASAHVTTPGWRLRLDAIEPAVAGLGVEARQLLAPVVSIRNDSAEAFTVIGADGLPFVRVTRDGVEANIASPDWYRSESPSPNGWVAPSAKAGASPRWVRIATGAAWSWFEHRIGEPSDQPWSIPARLGKRDIQLRGRWERVQVRGAFRSVLDGVRPEVDGLDVRILQGSRPAIFVSNETGLVLEIPGRRGEPFLRIGPGGAQEADGSGAFVPLGSAPRWAWVEPRAGWESEDPLASILSATTTVIVGTWTVPAKLGERPIEIRGRVEWVPVARHHTTPKGSRTIWWAVAFVGSVLVVTLAARRVVRVRRSAGTSV